MILAVDMGNSNIVVGGLDDQSTYFEERITTDDRKTSLEYAIMLKNILEIHKVKRSDIEGSIISSVVPPLNAPLSSAVNKITGWQISLAGQRLTARVPIGRAIHCVLIGRQIVRLPAQPITAVLLVCPPFIGRFLDPYHLHHRGACVPPHVILVFLLCAFSTTDTKPCHQHGREEKANARCDILHISCGPCHKRYCKNETDYDNFDTLHTFSIPPPWAEISFYDTGGWFRTASTNKMVSPI